MIRKVKREKQITNFKGVRVKIASPETMREWSYGEVTKPDTLNYRTLKPEKDGLFCERIFGPEKDFECSCGKYKKKRFAGTVCDRCGVEVTYSRVRRQRMGHIDLAVPVAHIWFIKSSPSKIGTLLDLTVRQLERILYYESYVVINPGNSDYEIKDLIDTDEYYEIRNKVDSKFEAIMGAEAIQKLLSEIDLDAEASNLRASIKWETSKVKKKKAIKKLKIVQSFRSSTNKPEWMVMEVLPVLPPTLRPLVPLDGGRFATADFNDLYRRVITRNNRLRTLIEMRAPEVILRNEKRMLQESVDGLLDNSRRSRPVKGRGGRALKSLTDQLKGKGGRFRQNLLGKRVDYSGRSVITVGPDLKLHQCGLPKEMAVELFKPYIIRELEKRGDVDKTNTAKKLVEQKPPEIWKILEEVIKNYPVLLNRAPTLHKLGIQAFEPILTEDKAIKLHPMVCSPYNADFDGDQMAVFVPLGNEARMEASTLMLSSRNLILPADGNLAMKAGQDIVLGVYYLTISRTEEPKADAKLKTFGSKDEVLYAYEQDEMLFSIKGKKRGERLLDVHTWIRLKADKKYYITTVGRAIFNSILPQEIPYVNEALTKGKINALAMQCFDVVDQFRTAQFLDRLKNFGFKYATRAGVTFSAKDVIVPPEKDEILNATQLEVNKIIESYMQGGITENERYNRVVDKWKMATEEVTNVLMDRLITDQDGLNSINMMYISGARGGRDQIKQLGAMRGLMDKPSKGGSDAGQEVIETPIKSNFKEGLSVLEYFISTHGARKGLADTALKTADAGYLTRRLVDVAQNAIIQEEDCGTIEGQVKTALKEGQDVIETLAERIKGQTAVEDVVDPATEKVILSSGEEISNEKAELIEKHGVISVKVRTPLTCESDVGICAKCYGRNLANHKPVKIGEPVGIVAAQSIGEPGTQLTLRTFHIGGTASTDIDKAEVASNFEGYVKFFRTNIVTNRFDDLVSVSHLGRLQIWDSLEEDGNKLEEFKIEYASTLHVKDNEKVEKGKTLFSWDPYNNPLIAMSKGTIKLEHFMKDLTYREEYKDVSGMKEITIIESKERGVQAQIKIEHEDGSSEQVPLPRGLTLDVADGDEIYPGGILGKSSRMTTKQGDITGGLPRVQDLFEARVPKEKAILTEISGTVTIGDLTKLGRNIYVDSGHGTQKKYVIPPRKRIIVHQGDIVESGFALCEGAYNPHDILKAKGVKAAQSLILDEIQEVYRKQGVKIDDKHIGIIIRQMFKKVKILEAGQTMFLEGDIIAKSIVEKENKRIEEDGGEGAKFEQLLLGITKASLLTESWLSAASFQETTKVITQASIEGKVDYLEGLKENIILGHRIPVGTGTKYYNNLVKKAVDDGKTIQEIIQDFMHSEEEESVEDILDF
ncbi:MAG: DNA-directed RNA polymerase subunit beta' [Candidatus Cloacimonadota bacterium]|nr:DNA-directed RNA polymerase subunit beta' [Candidatus Cloacimonadota bacterium]